MIDEEFEAIMRQWDSWRKYIAEGGGGSWPRDAFEALLEGLQERTEEAERERDALREALTFSKAMIDSLQETVARLVTERDIARAALEAKPE